MQATQAPISQIRKHQAKRTRRMKFRAALRGIVDRIFPGVDTTTMPDNWQPPVDNSVRLQDYQRRIKQAFDKEAA